MEIRFSRYLPEKGITNLQAPYNEYLTNLSEAITTYRDELSIRSDIADSVEKGRLRLTAKEKRDNAVYAIKGKLFDEAASLEEEIQQGIMDDVLSKHISEFLIKAILTKAYLQTQQLDASEIGIAYEENPEGFPEHEFSQNLIRVAIKNSDSTKETVSLYNYADRMQESWGAVVDIPDKVSLISYVKAVSSERIHESDEAFIRRCAWEVVHVNDYINENRSRLSQDEFNNLLELKELLGARIYDYWSKAKVENQATPFLKIGTKAKTLTYGSKASTKYFTEILVKDKEGEDISLTMHQDGPRKDPSRRFARALERRVDMDFMHIVTIDGTTGKSTKNEYIYK